MLDLHPDVVRDLEVTFASATTGASAIRRSPWSLIMASGWSGLLLRHAAESYRGTADGSVLEALAGIVPVILCLVFLVVWRRSGQATQPVVPKQK
jgi:hypothetical protein